MTKNTIISLDFQNFPWVGGSATDVAGVRASLLQLAAHFKTPIFQIERSIWIFFEFGTVGLVGICCEGISEEPYTTALTPDEVDKMVNSDLGLPVFVGVGSDQVEFRREAEAFFRDRFLIEFF